MAFNRPSLSTIIGRVKTDIETYLSGANARLARTFENALAKALAGLAHSLHGHIYWVAQQIIPDSAEDEYVVRWANFYGLTRTDATAASGIIEVTATGSTTVPEGTEWQRSDGAIYTVDADTAVTSGTNNVSVTAQTAGEDGNAESGTTLTIVTPIASVSSQATVNADGLTGGEDIESISALLTRLQQRIRNPPMGGGPGNYVTWALEVSGVTRAWEYANHLGAGTVGVTFVLDDQAVTIIPNAAKVTEVQDYTDARAPVTADVTVFAPVAVALSLTITDLDPDTSAVRDAIEASLEDYLLRVAEPGVTLKRSQIVEAIATAAGETSHVLTSPAADVTHAANEIPVLGTITYA